MSQNMKLENSVLVSKFRNRSSSLPPPKAQNSLKKITLHLGGDASFDNGEDTGLKVSFVFSIQILPMTCFVMGVN